MRAKRKKWSHAGDPRPHDSIFCYFSINPFLQSVRILAQMSANDRLIPKTQRWRLIMKKVIYWFLAAALLMGGLFISGNWSRAAAREQKILEFDAMVGVPPAFTGAQNPIRGVNGGGLPWTIGSGTGELSSSGHLEIKVQGLVFAAGPNTGRNTVASFRAIVSCLASDGSTQNVTTDPFPATLGAASEGGGNAKIEANLSLPQPCIAPIIFVTSPGGAWFATIGS